MNEFAAIGVIKMIFSCVILRFFSDVLNCLYWYIKMGYVGTLGLTLTGINDKIGNVL